VLVTAASAFVVLAPSSALVWALVLLPRAVKAGRHSLLPYRWLTLLLGALLWLAPPLIKALKRGSDPSVLGDAGQVMAVIVLIITFSYLAPKLSTPTRRRQLALGVTTGCVVLAAVTLLQVAYGLSLAGYVEERASGWHSHPNLWAVQVLVPTLGVLVLASAPSTRILCTVAALIVILASGSRTVFLALLIGAFLTSLFSMREKSRSIRLVVLAIFGLVPILVLAALLHPRIAPVTQDLWETVSTAQASKSNSRENLLSGIWQSKAVRVLERDTATGLYVIQKTAAEGWSRLQHQVILLPEETYSLSGEMASENTLAEIGILGAGSVAETGEKVELNVLRKLQDWIVQSSGPIEVTHFRHFSTHDDWTRLELSFIYRGKTASRWWVGPTPDQRNLDSGATIRVRGMKMELGAATTPYERPDNLDLASTRALSRFNAFRVAWQGFKQSPFLGWSPKAFDTFYRANPPSQDVAIASHAHNLFLQALFERGIVGMAGIIVLLIAITAIGSGGSKLFPYVVAAVVLANLFDYTFWSPGVAYSLVSLAALLSVPSEG
jgi:hypothetical protein